MNKKLMKYIIVLIIIFVPVTFYIYYNHQIEYRQSLPFIPPHLLSAYSSFRFELEREKSGCCMGELSPEVEKKEKNEEVSAMLIFFILVNLLLILLKMKVISRLKLKKLWGKVLIIFWIVFVIGFFVVLYLYFNDTGVLIDIYIKLFAGVHRADIFSSNFWQVPQNSDTFSTSLN